MPKKQLKTRMVEMNESYNKMINFFFSFPNAEITLSELSSRLKISKTTAKRTVERLLDEKFLMRAVYGKTWIIRCNPQSEYNRSHKIAFNLNLMFEAYSSGLREEIFNQVKNPLSIILFGSYRKGDDNEDSDIDIAVEVLDPKEAGIIDLGVISRFGFRKDVPVNIHVFCRKNIDKNLFANIANGIVLEGFLEVSP